MATPQEPFPVKLVISVLARHAGLLPPARTHLASAFGPIDHTGALMPLATRVILRASWAISRCASSWPLSG